MKKALSILLALVMVLSLCSMGFAAEEKTVGIAMPTRSLER